MYEYQPQIHGKYIQENNILNFEEVHLLNSSGRAFEFHRMLEIVQINEHFVKLKDTNDSNEYIFVGRREIKRIK
jgi:hypothetical protein